jgi:two-component system response regulator NreC
MDLSLPFEGPFRRESTRGSADQPSCGTVESTSVRPDARTPTLVFGSDASAPADTFRRVIRVVVADDHAIIRDAVKLLCSAHPDLCVVGEAVDGQAAVDLAAELQPDVLVIGVDISRLNGPEATALVRRRTPEVKVLALTRHKEDVYLRELLRAGASGYALTQSSSADLLNGIRTVARGRQYVDPALTASVTRYLDWRHASETSRLSPRETEVLQLTAWGYRNTEIAARLKISVKTVEAHKAHGLEKLGLTSRIELTRFALLSGWFQEL